MPNEIIALENINPVDIYSGGLDDVLGKIEKETKSIILDVSTEEGRKEIASLAYKVARTKTLLDDMGKKLGEEAKTKLDGINSDRRQVRTNLDALKEEIRKPLTDFEDTEKKRIEDHEAMLAAIPETLDYGQSETIPDLQKRLEYLSTFPKRDWQEFEVRAKATLVAEFVRTKKLLETAKKRADEQAELEKLRAEKQERDRQEEECLRLEREAQIKKEAAERAEREKQAAIEAERKRVADQEAKEQAETEKRESNKKHRAKINNEIKKALQSVISSGINGDDSVKDIIIAMAKGDVPHVKIIY